MGVTLERVQNKFACIIGELCSEPVVLSQFAIWLDLRLAEYKAKGAISLECSGEKPDPVWLKGHKDEPVRVHKREITQAQSRSAAHGNSFPLGNISQSDSSRFSSSEDRLSPDIVVVKEEPSDSVTETDSCIYPISLHKSSNRSPSRTLNRKRPAETLSSPHNASKSNNTSYHFHSQSPSSLPHSPKVVCHGATSSFSDNSHASNQSLMSIISGGQSQQDLDNLATNVLTDYGTLEEQGGDNSMTFQGSPLASTSHIEDESGFGIGQMEAQESGKSGLNCDSPEADDKTSRGKRYQEVPEDQLIGLAANRHERDTNKQTAWAVRIFKDWLSTRGESVDFERLPEADLNHLLRRFYAEARSKGGREYSKSSLLNMRGGLNRYITSPPFNRQMNILQDSSFQSANQVHSGVIKKLKREGKNRPAHKVSIDPSDVIKLRQSNVMDTETPWGLLRKCWFDIMAHFGKCRHEGLRDLRKSSFALVSDEKGCRYYKMNQNEPDETYERHKLKQKQLINCRMYELPGNPLCPVTSLSNYLAKLHPGSDVLFAYPVKDTSSYAGVVDRHVHDESVWYTTKPLGHNRLDRLMREISTLAGLSRLYTNLSVKMTSRAKLGYSDNRQGGDVASLVGGEQTVLHTEHVNNIASAALPAVLLTFQFPTSQ